MKTLGHVFLTLITGGAWLMVLLVIWLVNDLSNKKN